MLAHVLAVLGLALYAFEIYRTVQRFGVRRPGMLAGAVQGPTAYIIMAVVLTLAFFLLAVSVAAVPLYVAPAAAVINGVYLISALRYARRRSAERKARLESGGR